MTVKNTRDQTPLDLAIDNLHSEVTMTMLLHKRSVWGVSRMVSLNEAAWSVSGNRSDLTWAMWSLIGNRAHLKDKTVNFYVAYT